MKVMYKRYHFKMDKQNYNLNIDLNNGEFTDSLRFEITRLQKASLVALD